MSEFTHRLPHQPWSKPSRNEQEYFRRQEFRARMNRARSREAQRADTERETLMARHRDRCPKCGGGLEAIEMPEGRADQCPNCLGVWLEHEMFDRLTHPETKDDFLTSILRDNFLQFTTGKVAKPHRTGNEPRRKGGKKG